MCYFNCWHSNLRTSFSFSPFHYVFVYISIDSYILIVFTGLQPFIFMLKLQGPMGIPPIGCWSFWHVSIMPWARSLISGRTRCPMFILYFPRPCPRITHFLKGPITASGEQGLETSLSSMHYYWGGLSWDLHIFTHTQHL